MFKYTERMCLLLIGKIISFRFFSRPLALLLLLLEDKVSALRRHVLGDHQTDVVAAAAAGGRLNGYGLCVLLFHSF